MLIRYNAVDLAGFALAMGTKIGQKLGAEQFVADPIIAGFQWRFFVDALTRCASLRYSSARTISSALICAEINSRPRTKFNGAAHNSIILAGLAQQNLGWRSGFDGQASGTK
jgi:hypothetical protein